MARQRIRTFTALLIATFVLSTASLADIDPALKSMFKSAINSGDSTQILTVEKVAIATWPEQKDAIIALVASLKKAKTAVDEQTVDQIAGVGEKPHANGGKLKYYLDPALWNGQLELGGGTSTGNTDEQGLSIGLSFKRIFAEKWEHDLDTDFDYAKSQGVATKRKVIARYQLLWKPWERFYTMNYFQFEADKFSGYQYRVTENIGLGYEVINNKKMLWRVEGGPGLRFNKFDISGATESEFLGRVSNTFEMDLWENIKLTNKSAVVFTADATTFDNKTQFSARINSHLAAKLSFAIKHDTGAPLGKEKTDTISRATIVYDF